MQRINLAKNCLDQHMAKGSGGEVGGWPWQHGWPSASTALSVVANCPSLSLFSADVLIRFTKAMALSPMRPPDSMARAKKWSPSEVARSAHLLTFTA